jgi:hypothetical protein
MKYVGWCDYEYRCRRCNNIIPCGGLLSHLIVDHKTDPRSEYLIDDYHIDWIRN